MLLVILEFLRLSSKCSELYTVCAFFSLLMPCALRGCDWLLEPQDVDIVCIPWAAGLGGRSAKLGSLRQALSMTSMYLGRMLAQLWDNAKWFLSENGNPIIEVRVCMILLYKAVLYNVLDTSRYMMEHDGTWWKMMKHAETFSAFSNWIKIASTGALSAI